MDHPGSNVGDAAEGGKVPRFVFAHKLFAAPDAQFRIDGATGEPTLFLDLGDLKVGLRFEPLRRHFKIGEHSEDGRMLKAVASALKFTSAIRPGDAFPSELIDGSASLPVAASHALDAKRKLLTILDAILGASRTPPESPAAGIDAELERALEDYRRASGSRRVERAHLRQVVLQIVDELTYVAYLEDRVNLKKWILKSVKDAAPSAAKDAHLADSVGRILQLLKPPVASYQKAIDDLNRRLEREFRAFAVGAHSISAIRETRDQLHAASIKWDPILPVWRNDAPSARGIEERIAATYRFAARCFPATQEWHFG